jgi:VanZ family protein
VKRLVVEYWTPVVLWLLTISFVSTDRFSGGETSRILLPVFTYFFPTVSGQEFDVVHLVIRKLCHVTAYFLLAALTHRSLSSDQAEAVQAKWRTMAFVFLAAVVDELHQATTKFRTPAPMDVGYDCFGAVWALWLITSYETRRLRTYSIL